MTIIRGGSFPEVGSSRSSRIYLARASEFAFGEGELRSGGAGDSAADTANPVWLSREIMRVKSIVCIMITGRDSTLKALQQVYQGVNCEVADCHRVVGTITTIALGNREIPLPPSS